MNALRAAAQSTWLPLGYVGIDAWGGNAGKPSYPEGQHLTAGDTGDILECAGFKAESHLFQGAQPDGACGYVALAFLRAALRALQDDGFSGLSSLNFKAMLPPTAVSRDSVRELSKVLGNGMSVPKDVTNVDWLGAADVH